MNCCARNQFIAFGFWALFLLSNALLSITLSDLAQARCLSSFSKASKAKSTDLQTSLDKDFLQELKRPLVDELTKIRWDGDLVHHLFQTLRASSGAEPLYVTGNSENYHDHGLRYTKPVRHLIQVMRWRVGENPGYFGHLFRREKRARALRHKTSIDHFLATHLEGPFQIDVTQTKIIYRSLSKKTPFVLIESPFQRYFRVLHKDDFQMLNQDHYKASNYFRIDLKKSSAKGALYYRETHFDYAPFSKNEENLFRELGIFTDPVFEPIRHRLLNLDRSTE